MVSELTKPLLVGENSRLAAAYLSASTVIAVILATGVVQFPPSVVAVLVAIVTLYAYWNDGFGTCWLFTFTVLFGALWFSFTTVTNGVISPEPRSQAFAGALVISGVLGPMSFLLGAGIRELALRFGVPNQLRPESHVPLTKALFGSDYREGFRPLGISAGLAIVVGVAVVLVNPTFGSQQSSRVFDPRLLGLCCVILLFAATIAWRYGGGLIPLLGSIFIVLLGLFGGFTLAPADVAASGEEVLYWAFLLTLGVGIPGTIIGYVAGLYTERELDLAVLD